MAATKSDIESWLERGKQEQATHMIVVCDTYDHEDYPVYVLTGQDVREVEKKYQQNIQRVMEVYSYQLDLTKQLNESRAFHYE